MQHEFLDGKRKERKKKEKDVGNAPEVRRLHASYWDEEEAETNQMARWNNFFDHWVFD
jgi:hypothetical protein